MIILAGLGNPGSSYKGHRHNIGFIFLDAVHALYEFSSWRRKYNADTSDGRVGHTRVLLVKPMSFMNRSGLPIKQHMDFTKTPADNLMVAHDDIDLAPGKVRIKTGGGHGGHNGLRDIDRHIGTDYTRLRIGVGRSPFATSANKMVDSHVLSDFTKDEQETWVHPLIDTMASELSLLFGDDGNAFATKVAHLCPAPEVEPGPATTKDKTNGV